MNAPNPIAIVAAVLFTTVSLVAISPNTPKQHVTEINGAKVIDLAPVNVHPTANDIRAAALLTSTDLTFAAPFRSNGAASAATLLSAQLTMPYYSFGSTQFATVSKE